MVTYSGRGRSREAHTLTDVGGVYDCDNDDEDSEGKTDAVSEADVGLGLDAVCSVALARVYCSVIHFSSCAS